MTDGPCPLFQEHVCKARTLLKEAVAALRRYNTESPPLKGTISIKMYQECHMMSEPRFVDAARFGDVVLETFIEMVTALEAALPLCKKPVHVARSMQWAAVALGTLLATVHLSAEITSKHKVAQVVLPIAEEGRMQQVCMRANLIGCSVEEGGSLSFDDMCLAMTLAQNALQVAFRGPEDKLTCAGSGSIWDNIQLVASMLLTMVAGRKYAHRLHHDSSAVCVFHLDITYDAATDTKRYTGWCIGYKATMDAFVHGMISTH
jgi:hypothetical protein